MILFIFRTSLSIFLPYNPNLFAMITLKYVQKMKLRYHRVTLVWSYV